MPHDTDIECGRELESEILDGYITESDLTESGRRSLYAYRNSPHGHLESFTEFDERTRESLDFLFPVDKTPNP
jgi:hypothetical protein